MLLSWLHSENCSILSAVSHCHMNELSFSPDAWDVLFLLPWHSYYTDKGTSTKRKSDNFHSGFLIFNFHFFHVSVLKTSFLLKKEKKKRNEGEKGKDKKWVYETKLLVCISLNSLPSSHLICQDKWLLETPKPGRWVGVTSFTDLCRSCRVWVARLAEGIPKSSKSCPPHRAKARWLLLTHLPFPNILWHRRQYFKS